MAKKKQPPVEKASVQLLVNDVEITVPEGTTLLEAAKEAGTEVPHYCYHPELSSPAQCRLCLVEVEGAPKLMPSCTTTVAEGQVVKTDSESATKMRQGVLEFYLVNHPLDCPICDQSGECDLQDFVFSEGRKHGRSKAAKRVIGRDDFGGDILFYGDRCVMCTRCVRFMEEMEQKPILTVVERGNRAVIDTFFEQGLEEAEWAGNVVDICPVGALVSKDFLYKARAWDLEHTPSICPNCSMGCNIEIHTRDNLVQRFKPRKNIKVNGSWICDYGRGRYEWLNQGGRIEKPTMKDTHEPGNGTQEPFEWEDLLRGLAARLKESAESVDVIASPVTSNEDLGAVLGLLKALGGGKILYRCPTSTEEVKLPGKEGLRRTNQLAPNADGLKILGAVNVGDGSGAGGLEDIGASNSTVLVLGDRLEDQKDGFAENAGLLVYLGSHASQALSQADYILPITTYVEQEGTFVSSGGRVQRFSKGLEGPHAARPAWSILNELTNIISGSSDGDNVEEAFQQLSRISDAFTGLSYEDIGPEGVQLDAVAKKD